MRSEANGKAKKAIEDDLKIDEEYELDRDLKVDKGQVQPGFKKEHIVRPRTLKPTIAGYFLLIAFILNLLVPITFILLIYDAEIASGDTSLRGRLLDDDENPIENITITILDSNLSTTTDANGKYKFSKVPVGEHEIEFTKDGYERVVVYKLLLSKGLLDRIGRKNNVISFPGTLQNGLPVGAIDGPFEDNKIITDNLNTTITGRVTNQTGVPVVDAQVKVMNTNTSARTDSEGNYILNNVLPGVISVQVTQGQNANVTTKKVLFATNYSFELDLIYNTKSDQTINDLQGKTGTIMGEVTNDDDKPIKNALVILDVDPNKYPNTKTTTIDNGSFVFNDVPFGIYKIRILKTNHSIFTINNITFNENNQTINLEAQLYEIELIELIEDDISSAYTCTFILIIIAILTLVGAISALQRKRYSIAFIGALLGMLPVLLPLRLDICLASIFSLIGLVLLVFSRDEFSFRPVR